MLPGLLLNPYADNVQEWVHEFFLVLGSMVVGWVVGRRGQARTALNVYILGCAVIAGLAIPTGLYLLGTTGRFGPVYLPFLHKNFIGNTLAYALVIVFVRPDWLGWSKRLSSLLMLLFAGGIAASGSRQAVLSVFVAIVILSLRSRTRGGGRGRLLLLGLIPAVWYVGRTVVEQLTSDNPFNSASQRLTWLPPVGRGLADSPVFGVGQRWWYSERFDVQFQPPNAFLEMLTSSGVVGLIAFIVLCAGGLWVVFNLDPRFGNLALAVMLARFSQGQLDLYWVAGQAAIPWLMAGLAFGARPVTCRDGSGRAHRWPGRDGSGPDLAGCSVAYADGAALRVSGLSKTTGSVGPRKARRPPSRPCGSACGTRCVALSRRPSTPCDDLSFDVPWGEAVGIVGRNGAGKSTLLKVLTRITAPTEGRIELRRPGRQPAGGRHRLPPRADRSREHLPQRRDPRA